MLKNQFYGLLFWSILEAQIGVLFLQSGSWFFAGFIGMMLINNVVRAYLVEKIAKKNGLL